MEALQYTCCLPPVRSHERCRDDRRSRSLSHADTDDRPPPVSALVSAFATLHGTDPQRQLIHLPADGRSLTAGDVWHAHLRYAEGLRSGGLVAGQLVLLAVGNHSSIVALLLAARALDLAV